MLFTGGSGGRYAYGEGTSFAAPIVSGLAALVWQVEPRLASEQVARGAHALGGAGPAGTSSPAPASSTASGRDVARVYDVLSPRARGRARRRGNRVRVTVARSKDRTEPGDELAGRVTYGLLVSRDGGHSFSVVTSRRRRPFSRRVRLRGRARTCSSATACDGNGNCGIKRLGRFRRR